MPLILCIETSGPECSVCLADGDSVLQSARSSQPMSHSRDVTLLIRSCMKNANVRMEDLDAVAVSRGPGSYTGLRVGTSCAKGICYALNIPLISVDTTEVIARPFADSQTADKYDFIGALIDARRDEVYYAVYDRELKLIEGISNKILEKGSFDRYENVLFCGDGAGKAEKLIAHESAQFEAMVPQAGYMAGTALGKYGHQAFEDTAYFTPFYLKPPNITRSAKPLF